MSLPIIQNFVTVDSETKDAALSRLKDIIVYDQIKAAKSLNKFTIEQQVKALEDFKSECGMFIPAHKLKDRIEQLRQQLNGGE